MTRLWWRLACRVCWWVADFSTLAAMMRGSQFDFSGPQFAAADRWEQRARQCRRRAT